MKKILTLLIFFSFSLFSQTISHFDGRVKSTDGVEISYKTKGDADRAIIFVHGWSCNKSHWQQQAEYFSDDYKTVTIDLAGHGESGTERKNYTVELFAEDVKAVILEQKLEDVILVGHSMGGAIIAKTAELLPDRVKLIVGVDTYQNIEQKMPEEQKQQFLSAFKQKFPAIADAFISQMFKPGTDSTLVNKIKNEMLQAKPEIAISCMENMLSLDPLSIIDKIKCRIVTINGDLFPTAVEINKKYRPDFEVKILENTGHFVMLEKPDEFNEALSELLDEL